MGNRARLGIGRRVAMDDRIEACGEAADDLAKRRAMGLTRRHHNV